MLTLFFFFCCCCCCCCCCCFFVWFLFAGVYFRLIDFFFFWKLHFPIKCILKNDVFVFIKESDQMISRISHLPPCTGIYACTVSFPLTRINFFLPDPRYCWLNTSSVTGDLEFTLNCLCEWLVWMYVMGDSVYVSFSVRQCVHCVYCILYLNTWGRQWAALSQSGTDTVSLNHAI